MSRRLRHRYSTNRITAALVATAVLALSSAVPALAASDPTSAQYDDSVTQIDQAGGGGPNVIAEQATTPAPEATAKPALRQDIVSGLPFTGLDVVALAAVAVALTSVGFALRRLSAVGDDQI